ncbi:MAG TPA: hypothetical protein VMY78_18220 [Solirubrobacteraceae bacterium]|nr:hypothetical protein [Solirubrobacteraceae bacterium]
MLVLAMLIVAAPARAGTYLMRSCNVPGERVAPVGPWHWQTSANTFANDECARGGGFGINAGTMNPGDAAGVVLETGPIAIRRVRLWTVARLRSTGSAMFAAASSGTSTTATPVDLFGPPGGETLTTPYVSPLLPADTSIYIVFVSCSGNTGETCTPFDTNILDVRGVEVTLEEKEVPTALIEGGDLLAEGPRSGVRTLAFKVSDRGSGILRVSAIIGKTVVGTTDYSGSCEYAALAACGIDRSGSIQVDTRTVPDGIYPVSLRVTDAAGNEQSAQATTAVHVLNREVVGSSSARPPTAPINGLSLSAEFAANRSATLTAGYRKRVTVRGRLVTVAGDPVQGAPISIVQRSVASGRVKTLAATTTADGSFTYVIPHATTPRSLRIEYAADPAISRTLNLRVKAAARFDVSLRGVVVRYGGRVLSRPLRKAGTIVNVQGRAPGAAWKTFARRRADRKGDFGGTYRLRVRRPGVRLQFRVVVPRQSGYPFGTFVGRPVSRIVR